MSTVYTTQVAIEVLAILVAGAVPVNFPVAINPARRYAPLNDRKKMQVSLSGTLINGSNQATTLSAIAGLAVGQMISGAGIPAGTTITAIDPGTSSLTMSANATDSLAQGPLTSTFVITSVVTKDQDRTFATRGQGAVAALVDKNISLDVAVQKALAMPEDIVELDAMMAVTNFIITYLENSLNRNLPCGLGLMKVENKPVYDQRHLMELQVFTSLITLHFEVTD